MSLRDIEIKSSYETGNDPFNLINEFYVPVLQESVEYCRISGFFNSTSLCIASKGIEALIENGGRMKLLVSPELSASDLEVIEHYGIGSVPMFRDFRIDEFPEDHLQALAWLLSFGKLEIKIVVPSVYGSSLFHEKIGLFCDAQGNILSFSGSINETASGWTKNVEEFKVFRSWEKMQNEEYLQKDLRKFISYWNNAKKDTAVVFDLPTAVQKKLLKAKPDDVWELGLMNRYRQNKKKGDRRETNNGNHAKTKEEVFLESLFPHQKNAVKWWVQDNYKAMFIMATGAGKTRAAIGCLLTKLQEKEPLLVIVSTPQTLLSEQWKKEFEDLDVPVARKLIVDGSSGKKGKALMASLLMDISSGLRPNGVVFTTHNTASRSDFVKIIKESRGACKVLYICDEAHAAGSGQFKKGLLEEYDYRIGLSATPRRMFDDAGTQNLLDYFGNHPFEFTIAEAMNTINPRTGYPFLNPYNYHPVVVYLDEGEAKSYSNITKRITIERHKKDPDQVVVEKLLKARARIIKTAKSKPDILRELIEKMNPRLMTNTIVFTSDAHIDQVMIMLKQEGARPGKITEEVGARRKKGMDSERTQEIKAFNANERGVLVGINCLNEGIDIKNACTAIIMSSSTNEREYIQRIGRVIRFAPGKPISEIYDFITCLPNGSIPFSEVNRASAIAENASNGEQVRCVFEKKGVDLYGNQ